MDSIKRIISTDESLRFNAAELEEKRAGLEAEIAEEKRRLKAELLAQADAEIARIMAANRTKANAVWKEESLKYKRIGDNLDSLFNENRDYWAKIIFDRVIGGTHK